MNAPPERARATVMGIVGSGGFDRAMEHFSSLGGEALLLDPDMVCGREHVLSALMHAERAFAAGSNRSKSLLTETVIYAAGDRQINRASERMRPKPGRGDMVAVLFGIPDPRLGDAGMSRDDSVMDASPAKAARLGVEPADGMSCADLVLEHVAMVDLMKM
ncbi:MAG: hypothetical protein LBG62_00090 [Candidatus Methanoplasma sp.]|jgi:KEOPS complex subunit Cgi121|nr:hypothetical protein [Candidatus Methanoplasma sp.]